MKLREGVVVIAIGALGGCNFRGHPDFRDAPDTRDPYEEVVEVPVSPNRDLDLLFVVDDSPSMLDKQANLANNFPNFINVLQTLPGGLPNLHLGVITTDMGTKSSTQAPGPSIGQVGNGGCSGSGKNGALQLGQASGMVNGAYISDISPGAGMPRQTNYGDPSTLAQVFGQMARVGAGGCGFEQHLHAVRAALSPEQAANQGFLRPAALLAVVFVTDEDDCSIKDTAVYGPDSPALGPLQSFRCTRFGVHCEMGGTTEAEMNQVGAKAQCGSSLASPYLDDVGGFRDFLLGLKADPSKIVVAGIMGVPTPVVVEMRTPPGGGTPMQALAHSCTYQGAQGVEVADPAVRLKALFDLFPGRATHSTVCQQDLSDPLQLIGQLVLKSIGTSCLSAEPPDSDPDTAGVQFDCKVEDVVGGTATPIMACDSNLTPTCWSIEADAANCPSTAQHLELVVHRGATTPDPATVTRMKCRLVL